MIGVDTNLLVRLFVEDDPVQLQLVRDLLDGALARNEPCYISDLVLGEIEWVLDRRYKVPKDGIVRALQALLDHPGLVFDDRTAFQRALLLFARKKVEFSDALIGHRALSSGARTTYTFDGVLSRQEGFSRLS